MVYYNESVLHSTSGPSARDQLPYLESLHRKQEDSRAGSYGIGHSAREGLDGGGHRTGPQAPAEDREWKENPVQEEGEKEVVGSWYLVLSI